VVTLEIFDLWLCVRQGKLEPRALKCMFLGYPQGFKGYRLWCMEKGQPQVLISRDVVFTESKMYYTRKASIDQQLGSNTYDSVLKEVEPVQERLRLEIKVKNQKNEPAQTQPDLQNYKLARDREKRVINPPIMFGYADMVAFALNVAEEIETDEPRNYVEVIKSNQSQNWITAMYEEICSL